jgi:hypothetical protein
MITDYSSYTKRDYLCPLFQDIDMSDQTSFDIHTVYQIQDLVELYLYLAEGHDVINFLRFYDLINEEEEYTFIIKVQDYNVIRGIHFPFMIYNARITSDDVDVQGEMKNNFYKFNTPIVSFVPTNAIIEVTFQTTRLQLNDIADTNGIILGPLVSGEIWSIGLTKEIRALQ